MSDRIDPGPGWRLLKIGERRPAGYQYPSSAGFWNDGNMVGAIVATSCDVCRARVYRKGATKAIATRATVRIAFTDCVIDRTVSSPGGLSLDNMDAIATHFADRIKAYRGQGVAKYIMLEIQREGEP